MINLVSTVGTLRPDNERFFGQQITPFLYVLAGLCLLGNELQTLHSEDQNAFLTAFLNTTDEQMNSISIRLSVVELFEDVLFTNSKFEKAWLEAVLGALFFNQMPAAGTDFEGLKAFTSILQVSTLGAAGVIFLPLADEVQR